MYVFSGSRLRRAGPADARRAELTLGGHANARLG